MAVVDRVIPCSAAHARADVPVGQVHLGQQVDAIRDQALAEVAVAVVEIGCVGRSDQFGAARFQAKRGTVLDRVIPAQFQFRVAGIDFAGAGAWGREQRPEGSGQRAGSARAKFGGHVAEAVCVVVHCVSM